jgi:DNA polymerase (family 10)
MRNGEVAEILRNMGTLLEIKGEMVFKTRAYHKAADTIAALGEDIQRIADEKRLTEIPGIGKALEEKITQYLNTGKIDAYEKLTQEIPESILHVIDIPSVGPKKAKLFFDRLKIASVADLKKAAAAGKLNGLEGIKEKTIENIVKGIGIVETGDERMNLGTAMRIADELIGTLKEVPGVKKVETSGSLRRGRETIGDIDLLVVTDQPQKVMDVFTHLARVESVTASGDKKASVRLDGGRQVDVRVIEADQFGAAHLYFTGSKNFNVKLRQLAQKKDLKVNEYGVFKVGGRRETCVASKTEAECFKALGLEYVPPELREEIGEERIFAHEKIPKLIEQEDIRGEVHVHSTYSDGKNTIEEMVRAAQERGYTYLAVSDHSQRLRVAQGVSPEDLKKKIKEIEALNKRLKGFRLLCGAEVEVDLNGDLDYNDSVLAGLDVVIAAVHTGFEQDAKKQTQRLLKVCRHRRVHILAHPFGVHLGKREPMQIDFKEVCRAAADHHVMMEINSFPVRLDLNSQNAYFAKEQGVKFVINTDAHRCEHMEHMRLGVKIARRAWLEKDDVLNTKDVNGFLKGLKK